MAKQIGSKTVPLTPQMAHRVATMNGCACERPLSKARVKELDNRRKCGLFHDVTWRKARLHGKWFRIDGQHSSVMLDESANDGGFPKGLHAHLEEYACGSGTDLAELFMQFDSSRCVRTNNDNHRAFAAIGGVSADIKPTYVSACTAGIVFAMRQEEPGPPVTPEERARLVPEQASFINWAGEFVKLAHLNRASVIGAMFLIWHRHKRKATEFWTQVRDQTADVKDATRTLAIWLRDHKPGAPDARKWDARAFHAKCRTAWNAWVQGKTTDLKYYAASPLPELL